jgi:hypothetical protein
MGNIYGFKLLRGMVPAVILCMLLTLFPQPVQAESTQTEAQADTAFTKVIVKLKVPGINGLTNESRRYKAIKPGKGFPGKGNQADAKLKQAIEAITDDVLYKLNGAGYKLNRRYVSIPFLAMDVSPEALEKLGKMHEVLGVGKDKPRKRGQDSGVFSAGASGEAGLSAPMVNNTATLIGAVNAWNMGFTGDGWYVAVIDCGMRTSHDMFAGKDIVEQCYSIESECPNNQTEMFGTGAAVQQPLNCTWEAHGTWTTGVTAGNSATLSGIAPDADIIAVQVCSRDAATNCILDYASDVTSAMDFIYSARGCYPIAAVNLSIGYDPANPNHIDQQGMDLMIAAIDNLRAVGIPIIASSGNYNWCNDMYFPASYDGAVSVGASTDSDVRWVSTPYGSCYSSLQNLFAPGKNIYTASGTGNSSYMTAPSGTSLASPHVTGAWAIMKQAWPDGSLVDILNALMNTGVTVSACSGSAPRIQVDDAIDSVRYINVSRPDGSESVERGDTVSIIWDTGPAVSGDVTLTAETGALSYFIEMTYPHDAGSYTWTVPSTFPYDSQTKIEVRQGNLYGESQPFSVGKIDVTYPTLGRNWFKGYTYTITWNSEGLDGNIKIYALQQSSSPESVTSHASYYVGINIQTSYPVSAGSYSWTVPISAISGSYIIELSQDDVKGYSPSFNILTKIIKKKYPYYDTID